MSELLFSKFVGLQGVSADGMKVHVNELPGISAELADAVAEGDDDAAEVWEGTQKLAQEKLLTSLETELAKYANFRHVAATLDQPRPILPALIQNSAACYLGLSIFVPYAGRHAAMKLENIVFISTTSATTILKVFDLMLGTELHSQELTVISGLNKIPIEIDKVIPVEFQGVDVFVGVDITNLTLRELELAPCPELIYVSACDLALDGPYDRSDLQEAVCCFHVDASLICDIASVARQFSQRLWWAYAYRCGIVLLEKKLASSNVNLFTNTNRMNTEDNIAHYKEEARNRTSQAAKLIFQQLQDSICLYQAPEDQPGVYMGSFVNGQ
ncbi:hypothetical protein [Tellurirhabdus bombi]|uniref:hypothetical protein n=1 Tax=Tellurirhabdus bombi TaxID=2907205 RepID=UPI001F35C1CE|nr:hypothetical protein [Tellurirhabdus bombi]